MREKQKITNSDGEDKDILAVATEDRDAVVQVFFIRGGRLIGRDHFYMTIADREPKAEILTSFIKQFYAGTPYVPRELMIQQEIEDQEVLEEWLSERRGHRVHIRVPKKGEKEKLVELAKKNAQLVLSTDKERLKREEGRTIGAVKEIEKWLGIASVKRIEAFDISNTNGFNSVGSMIVYEKGKPSETITQNLKSKGYRVADHYASMREVLTRRFSRWE